MLDACCLLPFCLSLALTTSCMQACSLRLFGSSASEPARVDGVGGGGGGAPPPGDL